MIEYAPCKAIITKRKMPINTDNITKKFCKYTNTKKILSLNNTKCDKFYQQKIPQIILEECEFKNRNITPHIIIKITKVAKPKETFHNN